MKIVVIGGTGLIGAQLSGKLLQLGHDVTAASPSSGVNTITGEGLNEALRHADVVVDVSNSPSFEDKAVMDFFKSSTLNLLSAETYAGVKHHVALSIVGTDRLPKSGYLRAKLAQEELIQESLVPYSILRSTQFFEFAAGIAKSATIGNEVHASTGFIQPIASEETVDALLHVVLGPAVNGIKEVGGPEKMTLAEFLQQYLEFREDARRIVPDAKALYFGTELHEELLTTDPDAIIGQKSFQAWLKNQIVSA